ncbi:MAG: hypothetical protein NTZ65_00100 [Candidatus Berkelbacteria bacterium]|nr:hypothetical protein [Candidatus Berkelbacteria bacterium]
MFPNGKLTLRRDVRENPSKEGGAMVFHLVFLSDRRFTGSESGMYVPVDPQEHWKGYEWRVVHEYDAEKGPFPESNLPQPLRVALECRSRQQHGSVRYQSGYDDTYHGFMPNPLPTVNIAMVFPTEIKDPEAFGRNLLRKLARTAWEEHLYLMQNQGDELV